MVANCPKGHALLGGEVIIHADHAPVQKYRANGAGIPNFSREARTSYVM